ncbi:hypothetical protein MKX01_041337 [Papaver californicum]|nr:hypothetical protein MKX01_041337 [Papaver californicum]
MIWKIKNLIKELQSARGNATSMISLIMPPRDQQSRVTKMLVNRRSVLGAITSDQQRLKLYNKVPPNGLVLYTGTIVTDDGKEKKVTYDFEPFKPINVSGRALCFLSVYRSRLISRYNMMDGNGTLFGTLSGNTREILHKFTVDLPYKHGRGGQSALRFSRLRTEKCHNYVRKTAELAPQYYINSASSQPNVSGLILAGSADFKTELSQSGMFDPRLQAKILKVVDVSCGGENGNSCHKFVQETRLIGKYFQEIEQDTGKYVSGVDDTLKALEVGALKTLIVWENLDIRRYILKNSVTGETSIHHFSNADENDQSTSMISPITQNFDPSQEGFQFCRGYEVIGRVLRYQLDMRTFNELSEEECSEDYEQLINQNSDASAPQEVESCTGCSSTNPCAHCQAASAP